MEMKIFSVFLKDGEDASVCEAITVYERLNKAGIEDVETIKDAIAQMVGGATCIGCVFSIKEKGIFRTYSERDVVYVKAAGSSTEIVFNSGKHIVVSYRLAIVMQWLSRTFVRIHRSYGVNVNYITHFTPGMVYLEKEEFSVGRLYRTAFMERMNIWGHCRFLLQQALGDAPE